MVESIGKFNGDDNDEEQNDNDNDDGDQHTLVSTLVELKTQTMKTNQHTHCLDSVFKRIWLMFLSFNYIKGTYSISFIHFMYSLGRVQ